LQGAVGLVQLAKLDGFIAERQRRADYYRSRLGHLNWLHLPDTPVGYVHAWQAYATYVDPEKSPLARNEIMEKLQNKGIATRPGTHAIHMLGYYRDRFGLEPNDLPGARDCDANTMAIPLHNRMTDDDFAYVADTILGL